MNVGTFLLLGTIFLVSLFEKETKIIQAFRHRLAYARGLKILSCLAGLTGIRNIERYLAHRK